MSDTTETYKHEVHLNINVRGLSLSPTLEINETSRRLVKEGKTIYKFGLGQSPFPVPAEVVESLRASAGEKDYLAVRGLEELRQTISGYYQREYGLQFDWKNMLVGPGSKELMFLLQLVYYGDLIIPLPSWVSYAPQANIVGRPVRWLKTNQNNHWLITPEDLERLCRQDPTKPRILILNYPNNPTGKSYTESMLKDLADVARKYHVIVLSDEIYGEVNFAFSHRSIAQYYPEGTIISSGLSKWCGAGGWRLGINVFPEQLTWLLDAMSSVASETFTSTSAPIQYAAITAFEGGPWLKSYLQGSRKILAALADRVYSGLTGAGADVVRADGGFYLFPDFSPFTDRLMKKEIFDSETLCTTILKDTGVAMLPGSAFGLSSDKYLARLAYVDFDGAAALDALGAMAEDQLPDEEFLASYCPKIVKATDLLCDWLR
ncbi:pyridoxal phosphate-dependent aminotransferase [Desulforhopalus sp. IMCC35007]|uniref:pyridoxal phosphate-dependent aminotransferase n=1 Tax=Desulforhopalus sp. IMCC35007 TaxID=2569543 RepID=UPI0010AEE2C8|nr:pyridoxal phosphate-dependent aminotransferase [Desulforhopalus sp. IMCC35007]TKB12101.1 pyridoxal phosphate-dependent aminotransferase [Desulforhopalus sp. IMCC35007]